MMKESEDCMDLPADKSESCDMNLMMVSWIYDSVVSSKNSLV